VEEWGQTIRQYRILNGLTQTALAELVSVDQATVSRWERGLQAPDVAMQGRLRALVRVSPLGRRRHLLHVVQAAPGVMMLFDSAFTLLAASRAVGERFGVAAADLTGVAYGKLLSDELVEARLRAADAGFHIGQVASVYVPARWPGPDGRHHYALTLWLPAGTDESDPLTLCLGRFVGEAEYRRERDVVGIVVTPIADI
jgi:transcriptional regulator with XRE-family HTH domain